MEKPAGWVADRQFLILLAAMIGFAYTATVLPAGFVFDPVARQAVREEASVAFKLVWIPLIALSAGILLLRFRIAAGLLAWTNKPLLLFLTWCLASSMWAPDGAFAFRQAFSIAGASLLGFAFVLASWHRTRMEAVLLPLSTWILVLSLIVAILIPRIGVHSEVQFELQGSWRGIAYQKNGLGQLAAVALVLWFHAWLSGTARLRNAVLGTLLSLFLLLKSRSSTSLLLSLICCGVMLSLLRPVIILGAYRLHAHLVALLLVLTPMLVYAITLGSFDSEALAQAFGEIFGKDATFSGRTYIWAEMLRNIELHPWLGVGFNSFWHQPASAETIRRLGWPCPSAHNGYLDIINSLGYVGFALFVAFLIAHGRQLAQLMRFDRAQAALHLALFLYVLLANLTESGWFVPMAYTHVLLMFSVMAVSRLHYERHLAQCQAQQLSGSLPLAKPAPTGLWSEATMPAHFRECPRQ